ncbi:phage replication protein [Rhodopirellula bahusiensis]|uniref:Phage replication protein n=1 Tax=Rhodopirellula bahusiensis TaxID=2014065 RepID=A0A2G1W6Q6_9BACT|nr:phage replication protein [Rhodopirellula bahusiensis]
MNYPPRQSHHAHRITRLLFKGCAAQSIGHQAVCLVIHIAHTEDAARYQGPVRFWNSQLMEVLGFKSPKQLNNARDAAIKAGWLVYDRTNDRSVGHYWTTIPDSVSQFDDAPIEPTHSDNGKHSESGTRSGTHCGTHSGKPSNPIPNPKKSALRADAIDLELAEWMLGLVKAVAPKTKQPNLSKWANTIRLMREEEGHSPAEIKSVFQWANQDDFWSINVRCPDKLRKQFATLHANAMKAHVVTTGPSKQPKRRLRVPA